MVRKKKAIRPTVGDTIFLALDTVLLVLLLVIIAYPLLFVISASFSQGATTMSLSLIPKRLSLAGYEAVFQYEDIWTGYANSIFYALVGTALSLVLTVMMAYPLSRADFKGRGLIMTLCLITMYFSGGLIPTYLTVRNLGLLNTRWAVILPGALSVYNMIVTRTYFKNSSPGELLESASLDGCGNIRYLISILLPLSGPILAVMGLFYAVGYWNAYFDAMIYVAGHREMYPLALVLREILVLNSANMEQMDVNTLMALQERREVMKYAVIVVASLPVMLIYPFVQKFFVKGIMIGAVKG